jgi:hypothetical protein
MFGTTQPAQHPLDLRAYAVSTGIGAIVIAATIAIAAASIAINGSASTAGTAAAPAPLTAPAVRDLGSRDLGYSSTGLAANPVRDLGARDVPAITYHPGGFGPGQTQLKTQSGGSSTMLKDDVYVPSIPTVTVGGFLPGFLVDADQRRQGSSSSEGAPAARHAGLRAQ